MQVRSILLVTQMLFSTSFVAMVAPGQVAEEPLVVGERVPSRAINGQILYEQVSSDQRTSIEWAVALFGEAGLHLPSLRVRAHDEPARCGDNIGLFSVIEGFAVIDLCSAPDGTAGGALVLHELAHAWAWHELSSDRKLAFQELRGFVHWSGQSVPWHEQGREQAAEIIVWGLFDHPIGSVRIYGNTCDELLAGYLTLTGTRPLHGFTDVCSKVRD